MIGPIPVAFWPGMLIALALLIVFSWFLTRHIGLAIVAALSPLPGFLLASLGAGSPPSLFGYWPGFIAAGLFAGIAAPLAANLSARSAVRQALTALWLVFLVSFLLFAPSIFAGPAAWIYLASSLPGVAITAAGAIIFTYDEDFLVRINRAGEARIREIEWLSFAAMPRWGMSAGGIALVFSVLGFFGAQESLGAIPAHLLLFAATGFVFLVGACAVTRNVRRTLATCLAMIPALLLAFAASPRFGFPPSDLLLALTMVAMPVLFMANSALSFERNGDAPNIATLRGIERFGPAIAITTGGSAVAALAAGFLSPAAIFAGVSLLLGGLAALVLQPALTTMLYALFPRRVSLEEAFRKR